MFQSLLKKIKISYLLFFLISFFIWIFSYYFRPIELKRDLWFLVYYHKVWIGGLKIHLYGNISQFALKKFSKYTFDTITLNLDDENKSYYLKNFSIRSYLQSKLGFYDFLSGNWSVTPDKLDLESLLQIKHIKKKIVSHVKIINTNGYYIHQLVFDPDSVFDFRQHFINEKEFNIPPFIYEIKKIPDTLWLSTAHNVFPEKIKFYIKAEPFRKIKTYIKIHKKSTQILIPDSILLHVCVPESFKDSIRKYVEAIIEDGQNVENAHHLNVSIRTKLEHFLILNYFPSRVRQYRFKNG